ncbi:MAG TPA: twin-arginine translocase subunit TatC [Candidatus Rifleibacterium sp.]|nr:twin-arginine translocase subunit TatC [Candidatus Rifleibacterium sp.]HPT44772.1 twin-arginine translocase subunit TatC [Candidatus Rifleibacterium sp.]
MLQGESKEGSIVEHLEELRWAIIRALLSVTLLFPVAFYFSDRLTEVLVGRLCPPGMKLRYFSPVEPLFVQLKMSLFLAMFVAAPYILRQLWGFIAPGLYNTERRHAGLLLLISCLLFAAGTLFSLALILPLIMAYSVGFQTPYLEPAIGFEQFINLAGLLSLSFGIMFQCPALIFILIRTGLVTAEKVAAMRPFIIVAIFVAAAILTPPDVISQVLMAVPTWLLFELGLLAARFFAPSPR